MTNRSVSR